MSKYYDGALVMPKGHAIMNEEEMTYVEGGKLSYQECTLDFSSTYLTKAGALAAAEGFAEKVLWDDKSYTKERLAAEIYTHAVAYVVFYASSQLPSYLSGAALTKLISKSIADHANPINLGGDNFIEEACFTVCWAFAK